VKSSRGEGIEVPEGPGKEQPASACSDPARTVSGQAGRRLVSRNRRVLITGRWPAGGGDGDNAEGVTRRLLWAWIGVVLLVEALAAAARPAAAAPISVDENGNGFLPNIPDTN
jgi:hypothetical protein